MSTQALNLDREPAAALAALEEASREQPVVVFKHSPICPASASAEREFEAFLGALAPGSQLAVARIDVIAERGLARGLTAALGLRHESPQALWFDGGALTWHASHSELTRASFAARLS